MSDWLNSDTARIQIVPDAAPGGGAWGLKMVGDGIYGYVARYSFVPPSGTHSYRFSFWAKATADSVGFGRLYFAPFPGGDWLGERGLMVKDTSWTFYSMDTTFDSTPIQYINLNLRTHLQGVVHFDLVKVEQLN